MSPHITLLSGNLWVNIQSTSYGDQEILSLLHKFIIQSGFQVFRFTEKNLDIFQFIIRNLELFQFKEWNPEIFLFYEIKSEFFRNILEFLNMVPKIFGFHSVNRKNSGLSIINKKFWFPFHSVIFWNSTNFRIIPFPKRKFGKWNYPEILVRMRVRLFK